ncbi:uncharacterized protein LODBEIA_P02670 [Lodderomyces beijingensis]|uniref:Swi5-domain-containing protein n=1 Tax=Lodderomyces beijingensis TaxID=1775926 RepID=A0ABP0ZCY9_9ASCO
MMTSKSLDSTETLIDHNSNNHNKLVQRTTDTSIASVVSGSSQDDKDYSHTPSQSCTNHANQPNDANHLHPPSSSELSINTSAANVQPHSQPHPYSPSPTSTVTTSSNISMEEQQRLLLKEKSLDEIKQQCSTLIHELEGNQHPELIIKKHIQQLKKYNELKDVALQLITLIADQRQVKTTDILDEMKVECSDETTLEK